MMASDAKISTVAANAEANTIATLLSNGYLRVYGGDKPASADDVTASPPLAELRFAEVAFRPAEGGIIVSNPIAPDMNTAGGADATWYRTFSEDGVTPVFDGTIGLTGCNINLQPSVTVHPGGELHIGSISYRVRKEGATA
jgi:hypothetical protein